MSNEYVFKMVDGNIEFIGDFEGFYQNEEDPWGQSGEKSHLKDYYKVARNNLIDCVNGLSGVYTGCEVGCGLGYVTNLLNMQSDIVFDGIDISPTAITKAKERFPEINFITQDIRSLIVTIEKKYDIVILNQMLWYILNDLEQVFDNINKILNDNGYLIISMLFLQEIRYKKDVMSSFDDLILYCLKNSHLRCRFIKGFIDYSSTSNESKYLESILLVQKIEIN